MIKFQQKTKNKEIHVNVKSAEDSLFIVYSLKTKQSFIDDDVEHSINVYSKYQKLRRKLGRQVLTRKDLKNK